MKSITAPGRSTRLTAVMIGMLGSLSLGFAAEPVLWTWDTPNVLGSWGRAWGAVEVEQDPAQDNTGNGGGSMYISADYSLDQNVITVMGNHGGWLWNGEVRVNLIEYETLEFDIRWDTAGSTVSIEQFNTSGGDNGLVIWSARYDTDWQWSPELARILIPQEAATGWVTITVPINPTTPNLDRSAGIVFKKWIPQDVSEAGGVAAFWIDNVKLTVRDQPVEAPTLSVSSTVTPGLNLITLAGSEWQRQGIRTVGNNFSWVGSPTPTTYEYTVQEMPPSDFAGFNTFIYLVPRDPRTGTGPDWDQPDVVRFDMNELGDGSFQGTFRYKTDAPGSNGQMYGGEGELGSVSSSTPVGKWGITFNSDTSITIFSPEATTDLVLPGAVAAKFNDALTAYFGSMPNAISRIGQKSVLEQIRIQGAVGGVNVMDAFTAPPLDTSTWELAAAHPAGVMIIADDAALWLGWTLPDVGFSLEAVGEIDAAEWVPFAPMTPPLPTGTSKSVLIMKSELPRTDAGYWRMIERKYTKLQVLLPGETAAPGTPAGKTGTPIPQTLYVPFEVTVNAVDNDWVVMTDVTNTVGLTTSDLNAILPEPTPLVNGTVTLLFDPGMDGVHTITASDESQPTIQPGTSSEVTILNP